MNFISHIVSTSGGKDSTATLLLALKQFPNQVIPVFADTGNEHELTYEYLEYLEQTLGLKITRLKQDFGDWWWRRQEYIRDKWPLKGVPDDVVQRAVAHFDRGPSGNPYLDLCTIKGMFPSRKVPFCTQFLKTQPLTEFCLDIGSLVGSDVWSWQGVRRDESASRRNALGLEDMGFGLYAFRPIAGWTAQEVVDFVKSCGLKLNPLYSLGMKRVGCMPCVNANKEELAETHRRFPDHIDRIAEWESIVNQTSKSGEASFFPSPTSDNRRELMGHGIHATARWAKTFRGGKVYDPRWDEDAPSCSSSYGLCE